MRSATWPRIVVLGAFVVFTACGGSDGGAEDTPGVDNGSTDVAADQSATPDTAAADTPLVLSDTFTEPGTGLTWTVKPVAQMKTYDDAVAACQAANVAGETGWRLPTVAEARGLYRDCPDLEVGGGCPLGAGCLDSTCNDATCTACQTPSGQPSGQCKAVPEMTQGWDGGPWYWTSDQVPDVGKYWVYSLCQGAFNDVFGGSSYDVRCVK